MGFADTGPLAWPAVQRPSAARHLKGLLASLFWAVSPSFGSSVSSALTPRYGLVASRRLDALSLRRTARGCLFMRSGRIEAGVVAQDLKEAAQLVRLVPAVGEHQHEGEEIGLVGLRHWACRVELHQEALRGDQLEDALNGALRLVVGQRWLLRIDFLLLRGGIPRHVGPGGFCILVLEG